MSTPDLAAQLADAARREAEAYRAALAAENNPDLTAPERASQTWAEAHAQTARLAWEIEQQAARAIQAAGATDW